jgi:hypothetical protein
MTLQLEAVLDGASIAGRPAACTSCGPLTGTVMPTSPAAMMCGLEHLHSVHRAADLHCGAGGMAGVILTQIEKQS